MTVIVFSRGVKIANVFYVVSRPTGLTLTPSSGGTTNYFDAREQIEPQPLFVDCNLFVKSDLSKGHPSFRM